MKFLKNTSMYVVISMIKRFIPLLMVYFLTSEIKTDDMGSLDLFNVLNNFASIFISLSITSYIMRIFYEKEKFKIAQIISGGFIIQFITAIVIFLILVLLRYFGGNIIKIHSIYDLIIPFGAYISLIPTTNLFLLKNEEKVLTFGFFVISATILELVLSLYLLYKTELTWESRVYSVLITNILFFILHLVYLFKNNYLTLKIDNKLIVKAFKYSLPFIPTSIALFALDMSDRYLIEYFYGMGELGVYSTGYRFGTIILFLTNALSMAFIPMMYKIMSNIKMKKIEFVQFIYIYKFVMILLAIISLVGVHFLYFINFINGAEYQKSIIYVPIITIAYLFSSYSYIYTEILNKSSKIKILPIITMLGALINIVVNLIFLPIYGVIVACYSTMFSFLFIWIFTWYYSQKHYPLPWFNKKVLKLNLKTIKDLIH